jgi:hypothetical protein
MQKWREHMQKIIVWLIVGLAAVYTIVKFYRSFTGKSSGCCGECQQCDQKNTNCQTISHPQDKKPPKSESKEHRAKY